MKTKLHYSAFQSLGILSMLAASLTLTAHVASQDPFDKNVAVQEYPEVKTQAYRIDDILAQVNNYTFRGVHLPGLAKQGGWQPGTSNYGGGGNQGAGGGGGVFSIPDALIHNTAWRQGIGGGISVGENSGRGAGGFGVANHDPITSDDINDTLTDLIEMTDPEAWEYGGIRQLGSTLIITTTKKNHDAIKTHLKMIRESVSNTTRSITILITWLQIEDGKYDQLDAQLRDGLVFVDPAKLKELAREDGATGSITCFDGQTVHIVSGQMKNWIRSATPVVGSIVPPASQQLVSSRNPQQSTRLISTGIANPQDPTAPENMRQPDRIGYNPISETINFGAMLQITPVTVSGEDEVLLDIHSNIVLPMNQPLGTETIDFTDSVRLDRLHIRSHQFSTSLKVPLNQPIVVGGSTVQVGTNSSFYVIMQVHAGK